MSWDGLGDISIMVFKVTYSGWDVGRSWNNHIRHLCTKDRAAGKSPQSAMGQHSWTTKFLGENENKKQKNLEFIELYITHLSLSVVNLTRSDPSLKIHNVFRKLSSLLGYIL